MSAYHQTRYQNRERVRKNFQEPDPNPENIHWSPGGRKIFPRVERANPVGKLLLMFVLLLGMSSVPAEITRPAESQNETEPLLAVMDIINNTGEFTSFVAGMPDMLITELLETGEVKLVERTKVQTAMKALKLETSGLTQERNLELGKWLGVDGIVFGALNRVGDKYRLDIRAIDVKTGKIKVAASSTRGRNNILEIVSDIGGQLRNKLLNSSRGVPPPPKAVVAFRPAQPRMDSGLVEIQYKMIIGVFAQVAIAHQRVRVYLNNQPIHVSGVISDINQYFQIFRGKLPVGGHTLKFVHGTVDSRGRWIRELKVQPKIMSFKLEKNDRPIIRYKMRAEDRWNTFSDFKVKW